MMFKIFQPITMSITLIPLMTMDPLTMVLITMFMCVWITMKLSSMTSSWVTMIMFLIFIGGLMVAMSYFLAIQPNTTLKLSNKLITVMFTSITLLLVLTNSEKPSTLTHLPSNTFIMSHQNVSMLILLLTLLFLALIITVSVSTKPISPMRPYHHTTTI